MNSANNQPATTGVRPRPFPDSAWPQLAFRLRLSDRELAVVRGLFQLRNEAGIAKELGISVHTVHTHVSRLYRKVGVQTRAELFLRVMSEYAGAPTVA